MLCRRLVWKSRFSLQFSPNNHNPEQYGDFCFYVRQLKKLLNLLYGYLQHKLFTFKINDYKFDTFLESQTMEVIMFGCVTQSNVISSASHSIFACVTNGDLLQLHQTVGHISFSNALSLLSIYMLSMNTFLRCIIETKFVPSVLVNYEKQFDNESSDERNINVQQIFVCIINHAGKSLYVFSIYKFFDGMKSAQMQ